MRVGWQIKPLGDVLIKTGTADPTKAPDKYFTYIDVSSVSNLSYSIAETSEILGSDAPSRARRHVRKDDVIFATIRPTLLRIAIVPESLDNAVCSTGYFVMRPGPKLDHRYLFYWLFSSEFQAEMETRQKGASYPAVNDSDIRDQQIPLPPLEEQRRIVAVLDKAFAAIATASVNAQKNQSNARALFESYLRSVFDAPSVDWQRSTLGKLTSKIGSGATPRGGRDAYKVDGTPLIRSMNVHDRYFKDRNLAFIDDQQARLLNNVVVQENDVLLNITGASVARCCLAPRALANARVNQHVAIIRPHLDRIRPQFLELALTSPYYKDILLGVGEKGGSTRQAITKAEIQSLEVAFPSIDEQNIVVEHASNLQIETRKLSAIASQKLSALAELKQSLLQKAFAGELSAAAPQTTAPAANDNFATPQFTAQVIAFAQRLHEQQGKQQTFDHVKTQKALHLVESIGGIDLGRVPMKDAAGPNDMQHMMRATDWAVQQGFFEFVPRASSKGYDFHKLANYDALWAEAETATKPVAAALSKAIGLIVDSDSDFAELIATTHAAWNNLIVDGAEASDNAIVLAARDNWHSSKLRHDPTRFHDAIRFILTNNIIPDGSAKYVGGQGSLL